MKHKGTISGWINAHVSEVETHEDAKGAFITYVIFETQDARLNGRKFVATDELTTAKLGGYFAVKFKNSEIVRARLLEQF